MLLELLGLPDAASPAAARNRLELAADLLLASRPRLKMKLDAIPESQAVHLDAVSNCIRNRPSATSSGNASDRDDRRTSDTESAA